MEAQQKGSALPGFGPAVRASAARRPAHRSGEPPGDCVSPSCIGQLERRRLPPPRPPHHSDAATIAVRLVGGPGPHHRAALSLRRRASWLCMPSRGECTCPALRGVQCSHEEAAPPSGAGRARNVQGPEASGGLVSEGIPIQRLVGVRLGGRPYLGTGPRRCQPELGSRSTTSSRRRRGLAALRLIHDVWTHQSAEPGPVKKV